MTLRLMAVHAHPDDESSKGAATYAYYQSRGVEVMIVSCTGGERGDILNETLETRQQAERDLAGLRRQEMANARDLIGFQHRWLGYVDSGMPNEDQAYPTNAFATIPKETSAAPLVKLVREFKPQVMITYDENGGYPHPDHIRCHDISVLAFEAAGDAERYPDAGEPWSVSKLYYDRIFNYQRMQAIYSTLVEHHPDSPLIESMQELRTWMTESPYLATSQVPAGDFFPVRDDALRAHASQISPDSSFFFWPNDIQLAAWPYEDFQLVTSKVTTDLPERDLFAGIEDNS